MRRPVRMNDWMALLAAARRALPGALAPFDAAELLDVAVDHLAGQGRLIADDLNFRIEVGEAAQPLGLADEAAVGRDSPVSRAIFQNG